jgi:uncharacterized protein HemX
MNDFEDELRSVLRRKDPPTDFPDQVVTRLKPRARRTQGLIAAAVAACLVLSAGGFEYHQYQGRKARQELVLALEIASSKLSIAQEKVLELNRRTIHE